MTRITPLAVVLVDPALIGGLALGSWRSGATIHTGSADAAEGAISIQAGDWTYGVPDDVAGIGSDNAWRGSGRPECLAPSTTRIDDVRFAAVDATIEGVSLRPVIWVDCRWRMGTGDSEA